MTKLSLIIPTRNEEKIILNNLTLISEYMRRLENTEDYEILICDHSEDSTPVIVKEMVLKNAKIKYHYVPKRGIGAGLKEGIDRAVFDFIMLYDIDMGWDLAIIKKSVDELLLGYDIVYGSRYLEESYANRPFKRRIFSMGYRLLVRFLFNITIKDWNGNRALRKSSVIKFREKLKDDTGFFHTELAIYAKQYNLKIKEIPAKVTDLRNSSTSYVMKVALGILKSSLKKRIMLWLR